MVQRRLTQIRLLILASGKTPDEISDSTGIARPRLSRMQCGFIEISPAEAARIMDALGPGIAQLLKPAQEFLEEVERVLAPSGVHTSAVDPRGKVRR